jgi:calcineurin-like phosphoesterase family protein
MKTLFCSDIHFGHKNVINYCNRPYRDKDGNPDVLAMHAAIVALWNSQVDKDDTVYVLGDVSLNPKWIIELFPLLNGTKILVMGNHDSCFPAHKKHEKMMKKYLIHFKEIYLHKEITLKNGRHVLLSHLPYATEEALKFDTRYISYRPDDKGMVLVHGHLHGHYKKNGRMIDVGLDAHDMKLLTEDDLIALIDDERDFIPSSITEFYKQRNDVRTNMAGMPG